MNYYFLLYFTLLISLLGIIGWLVSEAKYEGRYSKLINRITFVFPFFALYAWFRLNLDFGIVLVFLTFGSLLIWLLAKYLSIPRASKESRSFFIIILVITIFRSFLYEPFQIPSSSMFPGLKIGDFLLVEKFTYGLRNPVNQKTFIPTGIPKRGDVVIFVPEHTKCSSDFDIANPKGSYSSDREKNQRMYYWSILSENCTSQGVKYIKRVIAEPGDEVIYRNKEFIINGIKLDQKILDKRDQEELIQEINEGKGYIVRKLSRKPENGSWNVPEGYYFLAGDNRDNSLDSRRWGLVPQEEITGKASLIWMHWECFSCLPSLSRNGLIK